MIKNENVAVCCDEILAEDVDGGWVIFVYVDWMAWHLVHSVLVGSRSSRTSHMVLLHARHTLVRVLDLVLRDFWLWRARFLGLIVAFFAAMEADASLLDGRPAFLLGAPSVEWLMHELTLFMDLMESVGSNVILVTVG